MLKLGITGGVGSGKSEVLAYLKEEHKAVICQADLVAHELQKPGKGCWEKIISYFGKEICNPDETIDRKRLGAIVFADEKKLKVLNTIVHPEVNKCIREMILAEEQKGTEIFVLEAALMTEQIYRDMLDEIWFIYTEKEVRKERLRISRGYTDEKIDSMMASQASDEVFREFCDLSIDNSGNFEETKAQIDRAILKKKN
ncbi:MAG: dephospho-CoA kinase [Bariatricus sp.]|nr:dephospho-CoA kinase [Bariatricus sp.]